MVTAQYVIAYTTRVEWKASQLPSVRTTVTFSYFISTAWQYEVLSRTLTHSVSHTRAVMSSLRLCALLIELFRSSTFTFPIYEFKLDDLILPTA